MPGSGTEARDNAPPAEPSIEPPAGPASQPRDATISEVAFEHFREQTTQASAGSSAGAVGAVGFVIAAVLLFGALEAGADVQQLLLAAIALTIANVIVALVWSARSNHAG